ncbi:MAG: sigma-70 family RNA polymerase sigma factor [Candidatus Eisenbacteria bacterium]
MTPPVAQLEDHRAEITAHCYRMLGSVVDADDAVQETMIRAWRGLEKFDGRSSLGTWLYRIATNVCLDELGKRKRRARPVDESDPGTKDSPLTEHPRSHWIEPVPDAQVVPEDADPERRFALRQSVRLAFVAALQHLPPKQRAALLMREVLDWSAAEIADALETTVPAANSALQRARATMAERNVSELEPLTDTQQALIQQYVEAFERYDVDALTSLLHHDVAFSMPPYSLWLRGPEHVHGFLLGPGIGCRGSRLLPTAASGAPAFGQYHKSANGYSPWGLVVVEPRGDRIASWTTFLDTETLFPRFGLPLHLSD